jgi:hypothetical protein
MIYHAIISMGGKYVVGIHPLTLHRQQIYRIEYFICQFGPTRVEQKEYIYIEIEFLN